MKLTLITSLLSIFAISTAAPVDNAKRASDSKVSLRLVDDKSGKTAAADFALDNKSVKFSDAYGKSDLVSKKQILADVLYVASFPDDKFSCDLFYKEKDLEFTFNNRFRFTDIDSKGDASQPHDLSEYRLVCKS